MTAETIAAGPALDAEVARRVFGVTDIRMRPGKWGPDPRPWAATPCGKDFGVPGHVGVGALCHGCRQLVPRYSTDIAAAWLLVEHFRARGWLVTIRDMPPGFPYILGDPVEEMHLQRRAVCDLQWMPLSTAADCQRRIYRHPHGAGDTPAEAIARAALEAVDAERDVTPDEIRAAWAPKEGTAR